jgi:hypothetical protein
LQEQASKHLKLLWSKAMVVSVEEKVSPDGISCESERRAQANYPMRCRKHKDDVKTGGYLYARISPEDTCLLTFVQFEFMTKSGLQRTLNFILSQMISQL